LFHQAVDDDEPGKPQSQVRYRIKSASAGLASSFSVNATTGQVTMVKMVDYESLLPELGGRVNLQVEAYDLGTPSLASTINITVEVEVCSW